jgi:hypothetical protein
MTRRRALTEILASMKLSEQELAISARQRLIGVWRLLRIEVLVRYAKPNGNNVLVTF